MRSTRAGAWQGPTSTWRDKQGGRKGHGTRARRKRHGNSKRRCSRATKAWQHRGTARPMPRATERATHQAKRRRKRSPRSTRQSARRGCSKAWRRHARLPTKAHAIGSTGAGRLHCTHRPITRAAQPTIRKTRSGVRHIVGNVFERSIRRRRKCATSNGSRRRNICQSRGMLHISQKHMIFQQMRERWLQIAGSRCTHGRVNTQGQGGARRSGAKSVARAQTAGMRCWSRNSCRNSCRAGCAARSRSRKWHARRGSIVGRTGGENGSV